MSNEEWDDPNAIPEGDPYERHWNYIVDGAIGGDFSSTRLLFCELIEGLRTGNPGALSYPPVRKYLVSKLNAALEAPSAEVSGALGITRPPYTKLTSPHTALQKVILYLGFSLN